MATSAASSSLSGAEDLDVPDRRAMLVEALGETNCRRVAEHGRTVAEWIRGPVTDKGGREYDPLNEMGEAVECLLLLGEGFRCPPMGGPWTVVRVSEEGAVLVKGGKGYLVKGVGMSLEEAMGETWKGVPVGGVDAVVCPFFGCYVADFGESPSEVGAELTAPGKGEGQAEIEVETRSKEFDAMYEPVRAAGLARRAKEAAKRALAEERNKGGRKEKCGKCGRVDEEGKGEGKLRACGRCKVRGGWRRGAEGAFL